MANFKDLITVELINSLGTLKSLQDRDQLSNPEMDWAEEVANRIEEKFQKEYVPFVTEVEEFNFKMNKPNTYHPTIGGKDDWMFVYNFILEELEEYKEACEKGDIVEILDALCDITYVSLGNGSCLHGLNDKVWKAYQEVQASNMSKSCANEKEAQDTVKLREQEKGYPCHYESVQSHFVVYRTHDRKVQKSINYFRPNLKQFFTQEELERVKGETLNK